jgi:hypothetical protein
MLREKSGSTGVPVVWLAHFPILRREWPRLPLKAATIGSGSAPFMIERLMKTARGCNMPGAWNIGGTVGRPTWDWDANLVSEERLIRP